MLFSHQIQMLKQLSLVCNTAFYKVMNLATGMKELARFRDASIEDFVQGLGIQVSHESHVKTNQANALLVTH